MMARAYENMSARLPRVACIGVVVAWSIGSGLRDASSPPAEGDIEGLIKGEDVNSTSQDDTALEAAYITILGIQGALPPSSVFDTEHVIVVPDVQPLSVVDAAVRLAALGKPVECNVELIDGLPALTCVKPTTGGRAELLAHHREQTGEGSGLVKAVREMFETNADREPLILMRSGRKSHLITLPGLERWYEDYVITLPLALSFADPDDQARELGADLVLVASRHDPVLPSW